jgi:hypothetical protein
MSFSSLPALTDGRGWFTVSGVKMRFFSESSSLNG